MALQPVTGGSWEASLRGLPRGFDRAFNAFWCLLRLLPCCRWEGGGIIVLSGGRGRLPYSTSLRSGRSEGDGSGCGRAAQRRRRRRRCSSLVSSCEAPANQPWPPPLPPHRQPPRRHRLAISMVHACGRQASRVPFLWSTHPDLPYDKTAMTTPPPCPALYLNVPSQLQAAQPKVSRGSIRKVHEDQTVDLWGAAGLKASSAHVLYNFQQQL